MYNNLPINENENKILEITDNSTGGEVINIRTANIKGDTDNYTKFIQKMQLNNEQRGELDSLLESFKQNLTNTIFSDDEKTLAVDSRIGLLHRILRTEIFDFMNRVKVKEKIDLAFTERTLENYNKIIENEKNKAVRNYIVFTPDTVLQSNAEFLRLRNKKSDVPEELDKHVIKVIKSDKAMTTQENNFTYRIDSNLVNVVLTEDFFRDLDIDEYDELKDVLDSSSNRFKISIGLPSEDEMTFRISTSGSDSSKEFHYELNLNDLGSMVSDYKKTSSNPSFEDWAEFGIKMDSLAIKMSEFEIDTIVHPSHNINDD